MSRQTRRTKAYRERKENNNSTGLPDYISSRNNNINNPDIPYMETNVGSVNDTGVGDSGLNRDRLTNYTSNHSADA